MNIFEVIKKILKDDNFVIILICNILFIFFIIFVLFYMFVYKNSSFEKTNFISELIEDLDKSPIYDLKDRDIASIML